jgi:hypothetical protein
LFAFAGMRAEGCVRGVNNASTMSDVEFFTYGVDLFINRLSLFSLVFFVVIEMKIEDTKKNRGILFAVGRK